MQSVSVFLFTVLKNLFLSFICVLFCYIFVVVVELAIRPAQSLQDQPS